MAQIQFRAASVSSFIAAAMFGIGALLNGCAGLMSQTVDVPLERLQSSMAKRFPFNSDFARLIELTISSPKLRTMPEENRIATEVEVLLAPRFMNNKINGTLAMDSALRFEPKDRTVRLVKPRISKLDMAGLKLGDSVGSNDINLNKLAEFIVENAMNDLVVYQVKEEELKRYGTTWVPGEFKVTRSGISVSLAPQK
jgi:hypothetical protein